MNGDRILVIHSFPVWLPQTQTWMYNQVRYLPEEIESHVVCESTANLDQFNLPNIHSLIDSSFFQFCVEKGIRKIIFPKYRSFLISIAKKCHVQILHSHFGPTGWNDLYAVEKTNMKHIISYYGYDVNMLPSQEKRWKTRYKDLFNKADLILCMGPHMGKVIFELGCPKEKIKIHHLGIGIETIPYKPRKWNKGEPLRVLIAASFREKKGIPFALEALAQLKDAVPLEITLIGDSDSSRQSEKEKQKILKIINKSGLKPKTRLLGYQPYSVFFDEAYKHHIFISPSVTASNGDTEGGAPVSLIEMMATGMPVISTTHCDAPEFVQYGVDNWLVRERDVAGLVNRMVWLIEHPKEWDKLLNEGRKFVEKEFSAQLQGNKLAEIYRSVIVQ